MSSGDWRQLSVLAQRLRSLGRAAECKPGEPSRTDRAALAGELPAGVEVDLLSDSQLRRATQRLAQTDAARLRTLLADAGSDTERGYLIRAFAAAHPVDDLVTFADRIRGAEKTWLHEHLSLGLAHASGGEHIRVDGTDVMQADGTTCASTAIVLIHALADPLYALRLTTGPGTFAERLAAEQERIHTASTDGQLPGIPATRWNRRSQWPQSLGTPPWGVTALLNSYRGATGTTYRSQLVDDYAGGNSAAALSAVERAVDAGTPVPIYTGDGVPRHVMVVVRHRDETLLIYEPTSGQVVTIAERDFTDGTMQRAGGWPHVSFVLTPER